MIRRYSYVTIAGLLLTALLTACSAPRPATAPSLPSAAPAASASILQHNGELAYEVVRGRPLRIRAILPRAGFLSIQAVAFMGRRCLERGTLEVTRRSGRELWLKINPTQDTGGGLCRAMSRTEAQMRLGSLDAGEWILYLERGRLSSLAFEPVQ